MGRCSAPCEGRIDVYAYAETVAAARHAISVDARPVVDAARRRMAALSVQQRFEEAAAHRDRAATFVRVAARQQRLAALAAVAELVAAQPRFDGGWDLAVVRFGRLAAAGVVPAGAAAAAYVDALLATAEVVVPGVGPTPAASAEEMECVLRWLAQPGTRLVRLDGQWSSPATGAASLGGWVEAAESARDTARPLDDTRGLRPLHRPARASRGAGAAL
jgi:DNA polymerase-3 subunit epsilon